MLLLVVAAATVLSRGARRVIRDEVAPELAEGPSGLVDEAVAIAALDFDELRLGAGAGNASTELAEVNKCRDIRTGLSSMADLLLRGVCMSWPREEMGPFPASTVQTAADLYSTLWGDGETGLIPLARSKLQSLRDEARSFCWKRAGRRPQAPGTPDIQCPKVVSTHRTEVTWGTFAAGRWDGSNPPEPSWLDTCWKHCSEVCGVDDPGQYTTLAGACLCRNLEGVETDVDTGLAVGDQKRHYATVTRTAQAFRPACPVWSQRVGSNCFDRCPKGTDPFLHDYLCGTACDEMPGFPVNCGFMCAASKETCAQDVLTMAEATLSGVVELVRNFTGIFGEEGGLIAEGVDQGITQTFQIFHAVATGVHEAARQQAGTATVPEAARQRPLEFARTATTATLLALVQQIGEDELGPLADPVAKLAGTRAAQASALLAWSKSYVSNILKVVEHKASAKAALEHTVVHNIKAGYKAFEKVFSAFYAPRCGEGAETPKAELPEAPLGSGLNGITDLFDDPEERSGIVHRWDMHRYGRT